MDRLTEEIEAKLERFREGLLKTATVTGTSGTKVVCTVESSSMTLPRLTSYTPVNGDVVLILCIKPGAWFVIGKPA